VRAIGQVVTGITITTGTTGITATGDRMATVRDITGITVRRITARLGMAIGHSLMSGTTTCTGTSVSQR
jgi:hypothetical protein